MGESLEHAIWRMHKEGFSDTQIVHQVQRWHPDWSLKQICTTAGHALLDGGRGGGVMGWLNKKADKALSDIESIPKTTVIAAKEVVNPAYQDLRHGPSSRQARHARKEQEQFGKGVVVSTYETIRHPLRDPFATILLVAPGGKLLRLRAGSVEAEELMSKGARVVKVIKRGSRGLAEERGTVRLGRDGGEEDAVAKANAGKAKAKADREQAAKRREEGSPEPKHAKKTLKPAKHDRPSERDPEPRKPGRAAVARDSKETPAKASHPTTKRPVMHTKPGHGRLVPVTDEQIAAAEETVKAIGDDTKEFKDKFKKATSHDATSTGEHSHGVGDDAVNILHKIEDEKIRKEFKYLYEDTDAVRSYGIFHDVAKSLPDVAKIVKSTEKFDRDAPEHKILERHVTADPEVDNVLNQIGVKDNRTVQVIVKTHHMYHEGEGGYGGRLDPPSTHFEHLLGQLFHTADVYRALTETRTYRGAKDPHVALQIIKDEREAHHPEFVRALERHVTEKYGKPAAQSVAKKADPTKKTEEQPKEGSTKPLAPPQVDSAASSNDSGNITGHGRVE